MWFKCWHRRFKESEDVINAALEPLRQQADLQALQWEAKFMVLLARSYRMNPEKGNDASIKAYQKAYDIQSRVRRLNWLHSFFRPVQLESD